MFQAKLDNGDNDFVFQAVVLLGRPGSRSQSDSFQQAGKLVDHQGGEDDNSVSYPIYKGRSSLCGFVYSHVTVGEIVYWSNPSQP